MDVPEPAAAAKSSELSCFFSLAAAFEAFRLERRHSSLIIILSSENHHPLINPTRIRTPASPKFLLRELENAYDVITVVDIT